MAFLECCSFCNKLSPSAGAVYEYTKKCSLCAQRIGNTRVCSACYSRFSTPPIISSGGTYCSEKCYHFHNGLSPSSPTLMTKDKGTPLNKQLSFPFPPSALNTAKETLKIKVKSNEYPLEMTVRQWYDWLNSPLQTVYSRVEFNYLGTYIVLAKLKPEGEKE